MFFCTIFDLFKTAISAYASLSVSILKSQQTALRTFVRVTTAASQRRRALFSRLPHAVVLPSGCVFLSPRAQVEDLVHIHATRCRICRFSGRTKAGSPSPGGAAGRLPRARPATARSRPVAAHTVLFHQGIKEQLRKRPHRCQELLSIEL